MTDGMSFDELLEGTVWGMANPEPTAGFGQRMTARVWMAHRQEAAAGRMQGSVAAEGLLASLWSGLREALSPEKLPELVLESRPVAVADPMAVGRSSRPLMGAVLAHVAAILLIGWLVQSRVAVMTPVKTVQIVALDAPPPKALPRSVAMGGGGGQRGPTPVTQGHLPKFAEQQIVPPKAPPLVEPKIAVAPTVEVQKDLKMADSALPDVGMPNSPLVGMSMGNGNGSGIGSGRGTGMGPGSGDNTGGGPRRIGGGVSAPVLTYSVEPEFSEEARKAKTSGNVLVNLYVDEKGNPSHVRVIRGVGMGLDERAIAAVRQYRFKPALENGKPVMVELNVEVNFQIF